MPVASKSPVLAGPHMCRAGRCFAPPASPARSHVGAPYRAARSGSRGSRAWRTRVQGSGTTQAAELSKLAGAMACAHSAGMWHCSGSRQAGMNPCARIGVSQLCKSACYACMTAGAATAPAATSFTAGCPVHTHGGARAPPAQRAAHSESGEECGPLSDVAPDSFEFARAVSLRYFKLLAAQFQKYSFA